MHTFELKKRDALLSHLSTNVERHGDRKRKVVDLKIEIEGDSSLLAMLDAELPHALLKAKTPEEQAQAQFLDSEQVLTIRRFPRMGIIKWDLECAGRDVTLDWGIDDKRAILLTGCHIDGFLAEVSDGGHTKLTFRIRGYPTADQAGKIFDKQQERIVLTIDPPAQKALPIEDGAKPEAAAAPAAKKGGRGKGKASTADAKPAGDAAPDSDRAFPDAIDGTAKPDNWPFPTRPDGDGAGASA